MAIRKLKGSSLVSNIFLVAFIIVIVVFLFMPSMQSRKDAAKGKKTATPTAAATVAAPSVPEALVQRYKSISSSLEMDGLKTTVYELGSYPSRMVGYPGCEKAAGYIQEQFKNIGLDDITTEEFKVSVPIDEGSKLVVAGQEIPIYAIWPNLVRTSHLPPSGIEVSLIDAADGKLPSFDGKVVKESAALVDFNSGTEWLNAPRLGARALLFVEPETTMRGEGESKFSAIPVSMPRFWISRANAEKVKALIKQGKAQKAHIYCSMPWKKVTARNITGVIRGTDPELRDQWIVLHTSYDGTSVVPSLAPSAESTCGIAAMLELARMCKDPKFAPKRSIMFVATSGHFQGLAGIRAYIEKHIDSYKLPGTIDSFHKYLNKGWPRGERNGSVHLIPVAVAVVLLLIVWAIWGRLKALCGRCRWAAIIPAALALLVIFYTFTLNAAFTKGFDYKVPDPQRFFLWCGLDLSSQTQGIGLFYKGYFYDYREDIQGKFSDLASRSRENSERVATVLGYLPQKDARFADGVNPISGKNWRNFVPGKFALDSEVVTLAGGKGVSFMSIDDGRQLVDTPFDTVDRINFDNLHKQLVTVSCLVDHWLRDTNSAMDEATVEAKVIDKRTVKVNEPLVMGYVQGIYASNRGKGQTYYKPKSEKEIPATLHKGYIKLTKDLPADLKKVYIVHRPVTKLGITEESQFTRMGLQGGFAKLSGNVVMYDPRKSFVPNQRVGDCLAVVRSPYKSFMGVRANIVDQTTLKEGYFEIPGVAPVTAYGWQRPTSIGAYKLDPVKGDIIAAPDQGSYGEVYKTAFPITTGYKDMPIVVFDCKATSVYDLVDPQSLRALTDLAVYDGVTNGAPKQYGFAVALPEWGNPHVEDMAVIFTEDTRKTKLLAVGSKSELRRVRIKLIMKMGPAATRLLLLNSTGEGDYIAGEVVDNKTIRTTEAVQLGFTKGVFLNKDGKGENYYVVKPGEEATLNPVNEFKLTKPLPEGAKRVFVKPTIMPEGIGYDFTDGGTLDETAFKVAHDMWTLDEYRLRSLESKGVVNAGLSALHDESRRYLDLAEKAKNTNNFSVFDSYCRAAWGYEARAYPEVTKTSQDVVNGVIFYLFLIIPFAFFCERLFFAFPDLWKQLSAFFAIFVAICIVFWFAHPAFQITGPINAFVVLLAFVMLALSLLVISIVSGKFEDQLKQFNRKVSGIHKADIGRMSVAAAAFSLGISNMRRRKARTVLTCVTLVLITFIVLSFTSIVSVLRFNKVPAKRDADTHIYDGILIRTPMWDPLQEIAYRVLKDEFGNPGKRAKVYPVAPRAWFYGTILGEQSFLTLRKGDMAYDAKAACGMVPDEAEIMDLNTKNRKIFVAGDWFGYKNGKRVAGEVDPHSIIVPQAVAEKLEIKPADMGKAKITFAGQAYTVVAIVRNDLFKRVKDMDNEPLTPVDFIMMSKQSSQGGGGGDQGFREYVHLEPDTIFIVPFETLMNLGGDVRSIAIKYAGVDEVQKQLEALMPRLGLNLYAGVGDSIYRYSSIGGSSSKGFTNVFIPVLIAALIVLNTMLGSVYERVREIGIFSSIGLAPNHIAVLFIAESLVYANLGAVSGYVLGQAASKLLAATGLLPGLYLNFSSMSAVTSTLVVVSVVLLSTLYPARKASEVATPSVDRSWKVPDPVGDVWDIVLPFAVTGEQAVGVNGFLGEWFKAYEEYSIGDFVTQDVRTGEMENEFGKGYSISCKTWLAPFDLGVSQSVELFTEPTSMEDVFEVKVRITRDSGDISNWKRVNRRFLNTLRKQFLIWRTLRASDRERYLRGEHEEEAGAEVVATH